MSMHERKLDRCIQVCTGISWSLQMPVSTKQIGMAKWAGMQGRDGYVDGWEACIE